MNETLDEIISYLDDSKASIEKPFPLNKVFGWFSCDDLEILGAVYALIPEKLGFQDIYPPLTLDKYNQFVMNYFDRCFAENLDSDWAHSQYEAGRDLVSWFVYLWDDIEVDRNILHTLKYWIEKLYREANESTRTCIVNSTLEHLFERKDIAEYFSDWEKDLVLAKAYKLALQWSK